MGDEKKVETEFTTLITTDKDVAEGARADLHKQGKKARIEQREGEFRVIVEIE